ncbi:MAG TPA: HAMP domain-containing sensor histidine kinase [Actinomycetota bacterium]|jgi:signal transduction histidine kinase|nr:HAMP domain-containing sensor histidine kinase [Actinomycetota bacterium]
MSLAPARGGSWTTIALVVGIAAAGVVGTLIVAAAMGVGVGERGDLLVLLVPAGVVTIVAAVLAKFLLARASMRQRFVGVALLAAVIAIANIGVLTLRMTVNEHDATLVTVLLVYSAAAGVAGALVVARSSSAAVSRLDDAARRLGDGDLDTRVGRLDAGPELDTLAAALDDMASKLQDAQRRERDAESMRRDLITTVSHDLRTPLASLRAMIEAIDDGVVGDPPSLQRYVHEMRRSVLQLTHMVDDLFELTQLDAGAIDAGSTRVELAAIVADVMATVAMEAEGKGLHLDTSLDDIEGITCSPRVARVLQNLLSNAVRHTPADGTVRVEAHRRGDRVHLAVQDSGDGIASGDLERVFDPFFRADPSRSGPGAGLGLALAKRIVEALGGRIRAEPTPSEGARFAVELPCEVA